MGKLSNDFIRAIDALKEKYGEDFEELNGLSEDQLSHTSFLDKFTKTKTVADVSVDSSANVKQKDIATLRSEISKPAEKLIAYHKIFIELKQTFGLRAAKKWLELEWTKALYMHDANTSTFISYCFAYDLRRMAEEGLFWLTQESMNIEPAKHLDTFVDFVKEFISFNSNRTSGACGLPNLIPYMYYFWYKDIENKAYPRNKTPEKYAKAQVQRLIYAMNQPYCRDGIQSAFVNTSIFDSNYFDALFGGATFPDGEFMIDHKDGIMKFQKWFLEEMKDIKERGNLFTFPVNTTSLLIRDNNEFIATQFDKSILDFVKNCVDKIGVENIEKGSDIYTELLHKITSKLNDKELDSNNATQILDYTIGIKDNKFVDEEFAKWFCEHNRKWNDSNIFVDNSVTSLSNCCRLKSSITDIGMTTKSKEIYEEAVAALYEDKCKESKEFGNTTTLEEFSKIVKKDKVLKASLNDKINWIIETNDDKKNYGGLGYFSSIGGTALKVGSIKVSTINLARVSLEASTEKAYLNILKERVIVTLNALHVVRNIIKKNVERGLLPNFQDGLMDFEHLYNTIGVIGIYETMKKFGYTYTDEFDNTYYKDEAIQFGKAIFDTIHEVKDEYAKDKDYKVNIEAVPGETAAYKFQQADTLLYDGEANHDLPLYGNQWIPLGIKTTMQERVRICAVFDEYCSGGSIMHLNVEAPISTKETAWNLLNYIVSKGVKYFALTGKISQDENNHLFYGEYCPECGAEKVNEFCRIVGFYTKISTWKDARKEEFKLRKWDKF